MPGRGRCCVAGSRGAASVPSVGLKASVWGPARPGLGRRAAAVAAAAAGSASESGPEGGRRRDGPVCAISAGANPGLLRPLCRRTVQRRSRAAHSSQSP